MNTSKGYKTRFHMTNKEKEALFKRFPFLNKDDPISKSHIYNIWRSMISRTENPGNSGYKSYGGAGIKHIKRWDSSKKFIMDMGDSYAKKLLEVGEENKHMITLDRIDPFCKIYSPKTTRFATRKEQQRNRTVSKPLPPLADDGPKVFAIDYAPILAKNSGIKNPGESELLRCSQYILNRFYHQGWNLIDSVTKPIAFKRKKWSL